MARHQRVSINLAQAGQPARSAHTSCLAMQRATCKHGTTSLDWALPRLTALNSGHHCHHVLTLPQAGWLLGAWAQTPGSLKGDFLMTTKGFRCSPEGWLGPQEQDTVWR